MGAWDVSAFGNDDAADFLFEFDDAHTLAQVIRILEDALDTVLDASPEIGAPDAAVGLAAAALVVAWTEPSLLDEEISDELSPWPRTASPLPGPLAAKAARVLERLQDVQGNELSELWAEAGDAFEYVAELRRWRSRLP